MSNARTHLEEVAELEGWECSKYDPHHRYMRVSNKNRFSDIWFTPQGRIREFVLCLQVQDSTVFERTFRHSKREQVVKWIADGKLLHPS